MNCTEIRYVESSRPARAETTVIRIHDNNGPRPVVVYLIRRPSR